MSSPGFQTTNFGFQGQGKFGFQTQQIGPVTTIPPVVGGSGKRREKYNEIIEIQGIRFSVPKDRVEEFLARFQPETTLQTEVKPFFPTPTVTFSTPSGLTVTADRQIFTDDIGVILVMVALADEDFYQ